MTFLWPSFLWSLLLLPVTVLLLVWASRQREQTRDKLADQPLAYQIFKRPAPRINRWLRGLQLAALGVFLLAAARPQAEFRLPVNKAAIVIAVDASQSMQAADVEPNRLDRAKSLAERFISFMDDSTLVGLVSFSDVASVLVPPTTDRQAFRQAVGRISVARNTSLVSAVVAGVRMLPGREEVIPPDALRLPGQIFPDSSGTNTQDFDLPAGHVVVLSDGVSTTSEGTELGPEQVLSLLAQFATDQNVRLSALPVGREGGTVQQIDGQNYFIPFDAASLRQLANAGNGELLFPATDEDLETLAQELGRDIRLEPREVEVSSILVIVGLALMAASAVLSLRVRRSVP